MARDTRQNSDRRAAAAAAAAAKKKKEEEAAKRRAAYEKRQAEVKKQQLAQKQKRQAEVKKKASYTQKQNDNSAAQQLSRDNRAKQQKSVTSVVKKTVQQVPAKATETIVKKNSQPEQKSFYTPKQKQNQYGIGKTDSPMQAARNRAEQNRYGYTQKQTEEKLGDQAARAIRNSAQQQREEAAKNLKSPSEAADRREAADLRQKELDTLYPLSGADKELSWGDRRQIQIAKEGYANAEKDYASYGPDGVQRAKDYYHGIAENIRGYGGGYSGGAAGTDKITTPYYGEEYLPESYRNELRKAAWISENGTNDDVRAAGVNYQRAILDEYQKQYNAYMLAEQNKDAIQAQELEELNGLKRLYESSDRVDRYGEGYNYGKMDFANTANYDRYLELKEKYDRPLTERALNTVKGAVTGEAGDLSYAYGSLWNNFDAQYTHANMEGTQREVNALHAAAQEYADRQFGRGNTLKGMSDDYIAQAKIGGGFINNLLVDAGVAGVQMLGDVALSAAAPGLGMAAMYSRAYGGAYKQALDNGADDYHAMLYGMGVGSVEVLTEKLFGASLPFRKAYGSGIAKLGGASADEVMEGLAKRILKNETAAKLVWSATSEGLEEVIADVADPLLRGATGQHVDWGNTDAISGWLYDGLVGALLGGAGGVVEAGLRSASPRMPAEQPAEIGETDIEGVRDANADAQMDRMNALQESGKNLIYAARDAARGPEVSPALRAVLNQSDNGKITNSTAEALIQNEKVVAQLEEQTGSAMPADSKSDARAWVKDAVQQTYDAKTAEPAAEEQIAQEQTAERIAQSEPELQQEPAPEDLQRIAQEEPETQEAPEEHIEASTAPMAEEVQRAQQEAAVQQAAKNTAQQERTADTGAEIINRDVGVQLKSSVLSAQQEADRVREVASSMGAAGETAFVDNYIPGTDGAQYFADFTQIYNQAVRSSVSAMPRDLPVPETMTDAQVQAAWDAGVSDSAAYAESRMQDTRSAKVGVDTGADYDSFLSRGVSRKTVDMVDDFAARLGVTVRVVDSLGGANGNITTSNVINIAADKASRNPVEYILGHEAAHRMQTLAPKEYAALKAHFMTTKDAEKQIQNELRASPGMTYAEAIDEATATWAGKVITHENMLRDLAKNAKPEWLQRFIDVLRDIADLLTWKQRRDIDNAVRLLEQGFDASERKAKQLRKDKQFTEEDETIPTAEDDRVRDVSRIPEVRNCYIDFAHACGFDAEEITDADGTVIARVYTKDGVAVKEITADDIRQSPVGAMLAYSIDKGDITAEQAEKQAEFFAGIANVANSINDFALGTRFIGSEIFTSLKANADKQYGTTYDFVSICTKTQTLIDAMSAAMVEKCGGLTKTEILDLYRRVNNIQAPVPCPECYVFTHWVGIGGLLDNLWTYQTQFAGMKYADVKAEFDRLTEEIKEEVKKLNAAAKARDPEAKAITFGNARGKMSKKITKEWNDLNDKIAIAKEKGEEPKKEYVQRRMELAPIYAKLKGYNWLDNVYFPNAKPSDEGFDYRKYENDPEKRPKWFVPRSTLFDLNNGDDFAANYQAAWKWRCSQGAGYGKAITPPTGAVLGEGILATNSMTDVAKKKAAGKLKNPFLETLKTTVEHNGKQYARMNSDAEKKLETARKKQKNQAFKGGQRLQSTSDATFDAAFDYLIMALEMQTMHGKVQDYTKVAGAVPSFEAWGYSTNQSLMPKNGGVTDDGKLIDTPVGGMSVAAAYKNREDCEHAGTITIGKNDFHIRVLMNTRERDFTIPYHLSGGDRAFISEMQDIQDNEKSRTSVRTTDYTTTQGDKELTDNYLRGAGYSEEQIELIHKRREARLWLLTNMKKKPAHVDETIEGSEILKELRDRLQNPKREWCGVKIDKASCEHQIYPNEFWDESTTYETSYKNTELYLQYCEELGFLHRFSGKVVRTQRKGDESVTVLKDVKGYDHNGEPVMLTDLAYKVDEEGNRTDEIEPYFWNLIIDRRMYGNKGQYLPQEYVTLGGLDKETGKAVDIDKSTVTEFTKLRSNGREYNKQQSMALAKEVAEEYRKKYGDGTRNSSVDYFDDVIIGAHGVKVQRVYLERGSDGAMIQAYRTANTLRVLGRTVQISGGELETAAVDMEVSEKKNAAYLSQIVNNAAHGVLEFDKDGLDLNARMSRNGRGHISRFNKANAENSAVIKKLKEAAEKSEYSFSENDDGHSNAKSVTAFDVFVSAVDIEDKKYAVVFKLRKIKYEELHHVYSCTVKEMTKKEEDYGRSAGLRQNDGRIATYTDSESSIEERVPQDTNDVNTRNSSVDYEDTAGADSVSDYYSKNEIKLTALTYKYFTDYAKGWTEENHDGSPIDEVAKAISKGRIKIVKAGESEKYVTPYELAAEQFPDIFTADADNKGYGLYEIAKAVNAEYENGFSIGHKEGYQRMLDTYGAYEPGENPVREVNVPRKTAPKLYVGRTIRTILESAVTREQDVPLIEDLIEQGAFSYDAISDKAAINNAEGMIARMGMSQAYDDWAGNVREGKVGKYQTAMGWALYNAAATAGDAQFAVDILSDIVANQRSAAQALQATRILKKLSPSAQLYAARKQAEKLQTDLDSRYGLAGDGGKAGKKGGEVVEQITAEHAALLEQIARLEALVKSKQDIIDGMYQDKKELQTALDAATAKKPQVPADQWMKAVGRQLAANIYNRTQDKKAPERAITQTILNDLIRFSRQFDVTEGKKAEAPKRTAVDIIRDYMNNREKYAEAWTTALKTFADKYGKKPEIMDAAEGWLNGTLGYNALGTDEVMMSAVTEAALMTDANLQDVVWRVQLGDRDAVTQEIGDRLVARVNVKGKNEQLLRDAVQRWVYDQMEQRELVPADADKKLNRDIRKELKAAGETISSIIRKGAKTKEALSDKISKKLVEKYGISDIEADNVAQMVVEKFNSQMAEASRKALESRFKDRTTRTKTIQSRLEDLGNLGAFTDPDFAKKASAAVLGSEYDISLNPELVNRFLAAKNQEERDAALEEIYRDIGRRLPATFADKWNAWRYMAMLTNARTHIRNIFGNAGFAPVIGVKNVIGTGFESVGYLFSRGKMKRTKGIATPELFAAGWNDFVNARPEILKGGKFNDRDKGNDIIQDSRRIFNNPVLEAIRRTNGNLLDAEDAAFCRPHYANALAQYCAANKITAQQIKTGEGIEQEVIDAARAYAIKEAQKATYRDLNDFSEFISKMGRNWGDKNSVARAAGILLSGTLPFRKTPANIAVRAVEYSPVGLASGLKKLLTDVPRGYVTAAEALDTLAEGMTGTMLLGAGVWLASQGLLRPQDDDDENVTVMDKLMGHQQWALEIMGHSYTIDWLAPEAITLFMGAELVRVKGAGGEEDDENSSTVAGLLSAISNISEPLLEMSCLSSVNDMLDTLSGNWSDSGVASLVTVAANMGVSYFTQAVPTLLGQAERAYQEDRMSNWTASGFTVSILGHDFELPDILPSDWKYVLAKQSAKIPGIDINQSTYIDAWGRTESEPNVLKRLVNNFVNPAYVKGIDEDQVNVEILKLYTETGKAGVIPSNSLSKKTVVISVEGGDSITVPLTAKQYEEYCKTKGRNSYQLVQGLISKAWYNDLSAEEKAAMIDEAYDYAQYLAEKKVLPNYAEEIDAANKSNVLEDGAVSSGAYKDVADYLRAYSVYKEARKEANAQEYNPDKLVSMQAMKAVNGLGISDAQKQYLYDAVNLSDSYRDYNPAKVQETIDSYAPMQKVPAVTRAEYKDYYENYYVNNNLDSSKTANKKAKKNAVRAWLKATNLDRDSQIALWEQAGYKADSF